MKEIALHLLDIVQNSVRAGASHVDIRFLLGTDGVLEMGVKDDGCGMSPELLARVRSPFTTTRTTRKVGLGIPLLMQNAMQTGGRVDIESEEGKGTDIAAFFDTSSIEKERISPPFSIPLQSTVCRSATWLPPWRP